MISYLRHLISGTLHVYYLNKYLEVERKEKVLSAKFSLLDKITEELKENILKDSGLPEKFYYKEYFFFSEKGSLRYYRELVQTREIPTVRIKSKIDELLKYNSLINNLRSDIYELKSNMEKYKFKIREIATLPFTYENYKVDFERYTNRVEIKNCK